MDKNKSIASIVLGGLVLAIVGILAINNEKIGDVLKQAGETVKDFKDNSPELIDTDFPNADIDSSDFDTDCPTVNID